MYDPTDLYAELNRKTVEALQRVVSQYTNKETSVEEYRASVMSIWSVTAGLTNSEVSELVGNALNTLPSLPAKHVRIWYLKGAALVATWHVNQNEIEVVTYGPGSGSQKFLKKYDTPNEAQVYFKEFCEMANEKAGKPIYGDRF